MNGKIQILLNNDGTVKIDARGMKGSVAEIAKELEALAKEVGGELIVEKHEPGRHTHHDERGHVHE
jgi:hypothetical protein